MSELLDAIEHFDIERVQRLLEAGADPNVRGLAGMTPQKSLSTRKTFNKARASNQKAKKTSQIFLVMGCRYNSLSAYSHLYLLS